MDSEVTARASTETLNPQASVLDEPTTLPEGAEIPLWVVEGDDLEDQERAALHEAIREGFADTKAGRTIDADEWAAELRSRL